MICVALVFRKWQNSKYSKRKEAFLIKKKVLVRPQSLNKR